MKKRMAPSTQVLCPELSKALGKNRGGHYFITQDIIEDGIHVITLVESRRTLEKKHSGPRQHAEDIAILREHGDEVWERLHKRFEVENGHIKGEGNISTSYLINIAYRHFMLNLRRRLGHPELEAKR